MKKIIYLMLMLASIVSCKKLDSEKMELMSISEGLMAESPDSAFVLLESFDISALHSKAAKARYALLYTKAQHKCYDTIKSDGMINVAVEYYKKKSDGRDYAEALMYRGAALYDMMDYKEALNSYKLAEDILEGGDEYELLALINSRMGDLHRSLYSDVNIAIERYKTVANYYDKIGHTKNVGRAYHWIGSRYIFMPDKDSALFYLHKSLAISKEMGDMVAINKNNYLLMLLHNNFREYDDAIKIGLSTLGQAAEVPRHIIHKLCRAYAKAGKIGSARMYFDKYNLGVEESLADYITLSVIEEQDHNYSIALGYSKKVQEVTDSILRERRVLDAALAEKRFDYQRVVMDNIIIEGRLRTQIYISLLVLSVFILAIVILSGIIRKRKRDIASKVSSIEQLKQGWAADSSSFLDRLSKRDATESRLKEILEKRIYELMGLMEISYRYGTNESIFLREYNKTMNIGRFGKDTLQEICDLVNIMSGGIIDTVIAKHPVLSQEDLYFIALVYLKFPPAAICFLCSYTSPDSVYVRKSRITIKMGINQLLETYLDSLDVDEDK